MRTFLLAAASVLAAAAVASPAAAHGDGGYGYDYAPRVGHDGFTLLGARAGVTVLGVNLDAGTGLRISAGGYGRRGGYATGYAAGYEGGYGYPPPPPPPQVIAPPPAYETGYMGGYEGYGYAPPPPAPMMYSPAPCGCGW